MNKHLFRLTILFLVLDLSSAKAQSYDTLWNRYQHFNLRRVVDANGMLDTIEWKAQAENDEYQLLKVYHERVSLNRNGRRWDERGAIQYLDSVRHFSGPLYQPIYDFSVGMLLEDYAVRSHSSTTHYKKDYRHLDEWSKEALEAEADRLFQKAIDSSAPLLNYPLTNYQGPDYLFLLDVGYYSRNRYAYECPTLFDLLVQSRIQQVEDNFRRDQAAALCDVAIRQHKLPEDRSLLIEYELERLEYLYIKDNPNDTAAYRRSLLDLEQRYGPDDAFTYAWALYLYGLDDSWKADALSCFDSLIQHSTNPFFINNANYYKEEILKKWLYVHEAQSDFQPSRYLPLCVSYCNVDSIYVSIYRTGVPLSIPFVKGKDRIPHLRTDDVEQLQQLYRKQFFTLPTEYTYCLSSTDIWLDSLPIGSYVLVFHEAPKWDAASVQMVKTIQVTDIQLTGWSDSRHFHFAANNRKTGEALAHRRAVIRPYYIGLEHVRHSDEYGQFKMRRNIMHGEWDGTIAMDFHNGRKDVYDTYYQEYRCRSHSGQHQRGTQLAQIALDRTLYRPGQTTFYKVLIADKGQAIAGREVFVRLKDEKNNILDSTQMRTNEFGSVAGSFSLPKQVGKYVVEAYYYDNEKKKAPKRYATAEIEVAEYRLPTFKVEMQKDEHEYAKGDTLLVSGFVRALSGVPLPDVSVRIRGSLADRQLSVAYDTTVLSNSDGFFQCPILTKKETTNLYGDVYNFTITATDVNGESQQASAEYTLSHYSLFLELAMDKAVDLQFHDTAFVKVSATNAAQCKANKPVSVVIERLKLPDYYQGQIFPSGANPALLQHSTEEYTQYFPLQTLNQEALKVQFWPAADTMLNIHRVFNKQDDLSLVVKDWPVGIYKITARSADVHGRSVVAQKYLQIYNSSSTKATRCEAVYAEILGEPVLGDTMSILVGAYLKQAVVYCSVYQENKILVTQRLPLDCAQTILRVPTDSKCNTGVKVVVYAVQNGVSYSDVKYADLRWPFSLETNELNLSLTHWNKMVEPGSQQEWELYVENKDDSIPVVSEVLAGMVDEAMYELQGGPEYEYIHSSFSKMSIPKLGKAIDLYGDVSSFSNHLFRCSMANPDNAYRLETKSFLRYGISNFGKYYSYNNGSRVSSDNLRTTPGRSVSSNLEEVVIAYEPPAFLGGKKEDNLPANARFAQRQPENTGLHLDDFGNSPHAKVLHEVEVIQEEEPEKDSFDSSIRVRSHFDETAFFHPQLRTDSTGKVKFVFTVPDQFTKWNLYATAHTRDMHFGMTGEQIFSRRSLMIQSNCPRFLREGDTISFAIRISNLCDTSLNGKAKVSFFDPTTEKPLDLLVNAADSLQPFALDCHGSTSVRWMVAVPEGMESIAYRVLAQAGNYGDGEEKAVPVLSTRMLFTESVPFYVPEDTVRTVTFTKLRDAQSSTLQHLSYSLEVTTNPVWTAVATLPYLTADRWSSNDDVATALFANAIARHIVRNFPEIERIYAQWAEDTLMQSMESPLMRNEQFKNLQTEETPWMRFAQSERSQREAMAKFFKQTRIDADIQRYMMKLRANQLPDGGWDWFGRYGSSEYVTSVIVCNYQKLQRMHIEVPNAPLMMNRALVFLDTCAERRYKAFLKNKEENPKLNYVMRTSDIRYLYARTFGSKDTSWLAQPFVKMLLEQVSKDVYDRPYSEQADVALVLHRMGRVREAREIMEAVRQQAHGDENLGMYWPTTYAYENPIAQQSALMEAFSEISPREQELAKMRQWLLAQKKGTMWLNNPTTTEAVFALLMDDEQELLQPSQTEVIVGGETFTSASVPGSEAGSGRFTRVWLGRDVSPALANVTVRTDSEHPATGSLYWQYYDVTDKADASGSGITIDRGLYHKDVVEEREQLQEVTEERPARVGERLIVRIVLRNDRALNFVHLRDQRAAALESVNFREKHSFSGDISYYEIPRDASTDIFINILPAGTHIIEYEVVATQTGEFSNGIATVECAYEPAFRAQSKGGRSRVR